MKKLTTAQVWFVHSLEVLALGAVLLVVQNLITAIQSGNASPAQLSSIIGGGLVAFLSKGFSGLMTNPQTIQAGQDGIGELRDMFTGLLSQHQELKSMFTTLVNIFAQQQVQAQQQSVPVQQSAPVAPPPPANTLTASWQPSASGLPPASFPNSMQVPVPPVPPRG